MTIDAAAAWLKGFADSSSSGNQDIFICQLHADAPNEIKKGSHE
jgi:hypothetical protein